MRIIEPSVELIWITPNPAKEIEMAARTCYKSEGAYDPAKTAAFLDKIVKQKHHESVVEHAVASYRVIADRGVSHEWVRHRIASYSQESTRYCNYSKDKYGNEISVIEPPGLFGRSREAWVWAMEQAEKAYFEMLDAGQPPQIARSVLPTCLKTEWVVTANFRSWMNFVKLRTDKSAHPQMRELALKVNISLHEQCPELFDAPQS